MAGRRGKGASNLAPESWLFHVGFEVENGSGWKDAWHVRASKNVIEIDGGRNDEIDEHHLEELR